MKKTTIIIILAVLLLLLITPTFSVHNKTIHLGSFDIVSKEQDGVFYINETSVTQGSSVFNRDPSVHFSVINKDRNTDKVLNKKYSTNISVQIEANVFFYSETVRLKIKQDNTYILVESKTMRYNNQVTFTVPSKYDFPANVLTQRDFLIEFVYTGVFYGNTPFDYAVTIWGTRK